MRWQWKCLLDNLKGIVPFGSYLRHRKYDFIEYRSIHGRADWALEEGLQQLEWLHGVRSLAGATVLEIGTGWEPIIPLLYSIAGASRVYLTDVNRLCSPGSVQGAIDAVVRNKARCSRVWAPTRSDTAARRNGSPPKPASTQASSGSG